MQKVIGVVHYYGNFEGRNYDGYKIHYATDVIPKNNDLVVGVNIGTEKISSLNLQALGINAVDLLNKEIEFAYNRYGQLSNIVIKK